MRSAAVKMALLFMSGTLLFQLAWILTLPPFRGIDEFDHAYRAAAVAEGQWKPDYVAAKDGRGWYLTVPRTLVEAATPVCESYDYPGPDNCRPVETVGPGRVTVASAAANYAPTYYWLIGTPSRFFDSGEAKVQSMRVSAAILNSALVGLVAWVVSRWARTRWPLLALAITITPIVLYSSSLGAPNGPEMLVGLTVWAALLGVIRSDGRRDHRLFIGIAVAAAVPLLTLRAIGPFWLFFIVIAVAAAYGWKQSTVLVFREPKTYLLAVIGGLTATTIAIWWILATRMSTDPEGPGGHGLGPMSEHLRGLLLWIFQSIAAFPVRNERAPSVVYACALITLVALLALSVIHSATRTKWAVAGSAVLAVLVSAGFNLASHDAWGSVWQGRYALPFTIGVPLLAAYGLDKAGWRHRLEVPTLWLTGLLTGTAQTVSVAFVLQQERERSPLAGTSAWHIPPLWAIVALGIAGACCWALAAWLFPQHAAAQRASTDVDRAIHA